MGPLLISEGYHYSPLVFGLFQALIFGVFIGGNISIKYAMNYMSIKKIIFIGLCLTLISSLFSFLTAYYYPQYIVFFIITLMVFGSGAALLFSILQRVAIEASQEPMGLRMSIFSVCLGIAGVLASAISSFIYDGTSIRLAYFLLLVAVTAIALNCTRGK